MFYNDPLLSLATGILDVIKHTIQVFFQQKLTIRWKKNIKNAPVI